ISGATGSTYKPSTLTTTTKYRREAVVAGTNISLGFTNEVTVTVRPQLVAGGIGNTQTLCYNSNPSALSSTSNASGGNNSYTYQWQISSNNSSWSNISGATGTTYDPPTLTSSRWYRRRVISCGETKYSNTIKVTIRPTLNPGSIGGAQTLSYNSDPATLTSSSNASGGNNSYAYQWQISTNGSSFSNISGATGTTFNPSNLTASRWYRRRVISCGETKYSNIVKVTINPQLQPGSIGSAQTVCYNGDPNSLTGAVATGGNNSYSYQWQSKCQFGGCSWTNISGATGRDYNPSVLTATTHYRRRVISEGITKYSNEITVTVRSSLNAGTLSGAQTICYNGNPSAISSGTSVSGGDGSYSYQWQVSSNNSSWSNISGATGATYDPGVLTSNRWYRRRVSSCGETKYTSSIKVTVYPALSAGSIGNAQTLAYNSDPSSLTNTGNASGGNGSIAYQWQISSDNSSWSNISGATSSTYNPTPLTSSRWYRRRAISCGQTKYTNTIKVTINPQLQGGFIGSFRTICYDENTSTLTNQSSVSGGDGSYTFQSEKKCNELGCNWEDVPGATSETYDPPALTETTHYRRTVTSEGIEKNSNEITVTVRDELTSGSISGPAPVCYNGNPSAFGGSGAGGGDASYAYQWMSSASENSGYTNITGATNETYDPGPLTVNTWYKRVVTSCGQTKETVPVMITVRPVLNPGTIGNPQTIRYDGNPTALTSTADASGGYGGIDYRWEVRNSSGTFVPISGETNANYDPPQLTETKEYQRVAISCGQELPSNVITVTVNEELQGGTILNSFTACSTESVAFPGNVPATGGD
ncbi:MAG: hypothetical protein HRU12_02120, partial [Phaeodactylibacter sp.]|nr:hypothetical protein [Phaeodactylibacter sp.]